MQGGARLSLWQAHAGRGVRATLRDGDLWVVSQFNIEGRESTRDTDLGAKSEICRLLNALAAEGPAMAVISSGLPEVLRLSRRTAVMCEGTFGQRHP